MAAETTLDDTHRPSADSQPTPDPVAMREFAAKLDRANMKKIGALHFAMVMGALTLWGAGIAWAQTRAGRSRSWRRSRTR